MLGEVVFTVAFAVYVGSRAVQAATKWVSVTEWNWNYFHAELVHLLNLVYFAGFYAYGLMVDNEAVHGQPYAGVAKWGWGLVSWLSSWNNFPIVGDEDFIKALGHVAVGVVDAQTWTQRNKGGVNVNGVSIAWEVDGVNSVVTEVTTHPVHSLMVGGKTMLYEQVFAHAHYVGGIEQRSVFGGYKVQVSYHFQALFHGNTFVQVTLVVALVGQAWLWCSFPAHVWVIVKVFLQKRTIA